MTYHAEQASELKNNLDEVINQYRKGSMLAVTAIGVLELLKSELLKELDEPVTSEQTNKY